MRVSKRIYVSQADINNSVNGDPYNDAVHQCIRRNGLLKGKCFAVEGAGVFIGPNRGLIENMTIPQIRLSNKGFDFVNSLDSFTATPTHITLIDETGKYLV